MTSPYLEHNERIATAINLGESQFREFKSALEGPEDDKKPRSPKSIKKDIGEALVAFANADGGELLIGVEDDGRVTGINHEKTVINDLLNSYKTQVHPQTPLPQPLQALVVIEGTKVIYFSIEKSSSQVHLTSDGRCLQRKDRETVPVSSEQIKFERQEQISREYDRQFIDGADVSTLDLDVISRIGQDIAPGMSNEKLLQLLDLADFSSGSVRLRRAALLLFAKDIHRWHPRSEVRILQVAGKEIKTGKNYNVVQDNITTGSVFALISQAWEALRPHLVQTKFSLGGMFQEHIMYPEDACREALTNAIAHRDYSIDGRGIEVFIFEDRMEVHSPGALLSNVSINELKKLKGLHQSRNVHIARSLRELGYMREMGEGLRRIYQLMKEHDLVEPELSSDLESFTIVLHHKSVFSEEAQRWISGFENFKLTREENKIVLLGKDGFTFSPKQLRSTLDIVDTDAYRVLVEGLQLKGILFRAMSKSKVHWQAKKMGKSANSIPSLKVRNPHECEANFTELMLGFKAVGPQQTIIEPTLKKILE
jgi:ATP-dependent DNA helicase RecG